jgi:hypothetical protein
MKIEIREADAEMDTEREKQRTMKRNDPEQEADG